MCAEWDAEVAITPDDARAAVAAAYPEFRTSRVTPYASGWDNTAFLFDDWALFRFPRRAIAVAGLEREIAVLPHLAARLPLPISAPHFASRRTDDERAWPFAGYRLLAGRPADVSDLNDEARSKLARPLGHFLRALHGVPLDTEPFASVGPDTFARFDPARTAKASARVESLAARGTAVPPAIFAWFEGHPPRPATQPALVHGDLSAGHLLLDAHGAPSGVIDWGDLHVGTPAIDLTVAFTMLPPAARETFREAYGAIDDATWDAARWRAVYVAILLLDYGLAAGVAEAQRTGEAALSLIGRLA